MKLKTLNDVIEQKPKWRDHNKVEICATCLKAEAIKWVKEDKEVETRLHTDDINTWDISLRRWMRRLNITEEDLK